MATFIITLLEENIHTHPSGIEKISYPDGSIYEGQIVDGVPSGRGRFIHPAGFVVYMGHWKDGLMHGYGRAYYPDGTVSCEGEYRNGLVHGIASMFDADGNKVLEGYFEHGKYKKPLKEREQDAALKNMLSPMQFPLVMNGQLMRDFLAAPMPCCALGVVEEHSRKMGLIALRLNDVVPRQVEDRGMRFGHTLYGTSRYEVIHFAFEFYGFKTYNVLINPNNPLVRAVLSLMVESGEYFFFLLTSDHNVTAFRSDLEDGPLIGGITTNLARLQQSTTTPTQYQKAVSAFAKRPDPPGELLQWVCREHVEYLDLSRDRLELKPSR